MNLINGLVQSKIAEAIIVHVISASFFDSLNIDGSDVGNVITFFLFLF